MKRYFDIIFWVIISASLILIFGISAANTVHAFYFVSFLIPIIIATSWVFNTVLLPRYLLKKRYLKFILYTFYTLIVSINLEMIIVFLAFILLGYYDFEDMGSLIVDFRLMPLIMYFIVFISGFVSMVRQYFSMLLKNEELNRIRVEGNGYLIVRVNRQNRKIDHSSILYIESMTDYVRIFISQGDKHITRENISNLDDRLPDQFIRIHRSYIINLKHLDSYTKEFVTVSGKKLPISRTYKNRCMDVFFDTID